MKVLHTISGLDINSGGPSLSTWSLIQGLRSHGIDAGILTFKSGNSEDQMIGSGDFVHAIVPPKNTRFGYSHEFGRFLKNHPYDLYHGHALWQYPTHALSAHARKVKEPYIITPRGMLYPEGLRKSALYKKIALQVYQRKDLERADVIHATCMQELQYIRELGFKNPIAVIPNSIDIKIPDPIAGLQKEKNQVGFIGRFAPIKNLEMLIQAWALSGKTNPEWELVLIGDGDASYTSSLKRLVETLGIKNIRFPGFLSGEDKEKALQSLDYLVLPSKSENFGMVVPEALIRGIPVIASKGTPWEELQPSNAGWWVDTDIKSLSEVLDLVVKLDDESRIRFGMNGRRLVELNYSTEAVAHKMILLYKWILKEKEVQNFIFLT